MMHSRLSDAPRPAAWQAEASEPLSSGSRPMLGGLGRSLRFHAALETLNTTDRQMLLAALDELTRPMSAREMDEALMVTGLPRSDRKRLVAALKGFPIIVVGKA